MSKTPLATKAEQTTATNIIAYLRNSRPRTIGTAIRSREAPGSFAGQFIRPPGSDRLAETRNFQMDHPNILPVTYVMAQNLRCGLSISAVARQSAADAYFEWPYRIESGRSPIRTICKPCQ